jgi:hypothetical protein
MYRRTVIAGIQPLLAQHFNLTVELPLKSIVRGYRYAVVPNTWTNRKEGYRSSRSRKWDRDIFSSSSIVFLRRALDARISAAPRNSERLNSKCGIGDTERKKVIIGRDQGKVSSRVCRM